MKKSTIVSILAGIGAVDVMIALYLTARGIFNKNKVNHRYEEKWEEVPFIIEE